VFWHCIVRLIVTKIFEELVFSILGLRMEMAGSSEILVPIYQITWHHIQGNSNLDSWCKNQKSYEYKCQTICHSGNFQPEKFIKEKLHQNSFKFACYIYEYTMFSEMGTLCDSLTITTSWTKRM
jgi:hypothetical protein